MLGVWICISSQYGCHVMFGEGKKRAYTLFQNKQLIRACGVGDVIAVMDLIEDGVDVDCVSQDDNRVRQKYH